MILKFPNSAARDDFLGRLEGVAETRNMRIRRSHTEPTVLTVRTVDQMTETQLRSRLSPLLGPEVKVFEDIQFTPMV